MARFNPCLTPAAPETTDADPQPSNITCEPLQVGTRVYCILYGGMEGIIYKIRGEQKPETVKDLHGVAVMGGNADFDIVFTGERAHVSRISEAIVRGSVQWSIEDGLATAEEIQAALVAAEERKQRLEAEETRKGNERSAKRAALPKQHPWLTPVAKSGKSSHAQGAANLKAELARTFPGVKFSVKSESYSGGDAIRVHWEAGPTTKEVCAVSDKYQEGSFDGMTDSYNYNHENVWPDVFGGAKYVTESRSFSGAGLAAVGTDFYELVGRALCALQHVEYSGQFTKIMGDGSPDLGSYVNELLGRTSFPVGAKFKDVEYVPSAERTGANDYWCRIVFDAPAPAPVPAAGGGLAIIETKHTKTGVDLFVVQLADRVERPEYERINKLCRAHGGYYSSFRGNGAIPGFTFKVRAQAEAFLAVLTPAAAPVAPAAAHAVPCVPVPCVPDAPSVPEPASLPAATPQVAAMPGMTPLGMAPKPVVPAVPLVPAVPAVPAWRRRTLK